MVFGTKARLQDQRQRRLFAITTAFASIVIVLVLASLAQTVLARANSYETDLATYFNGAQRLRQGLPLYRADIDMVRDGAFLNFIYPPLLALLFVPFASYASAWWGWAAITLACWAGALVLLVRELAPDLARRIGPAWWPVLIAALVNFTPVGAHFFWGQLQLPLLLVLALAWRCLRREREIGAGVFLGIAIALKLYPLVLIGPLVIQRRWRCVAVALACAGGVLLLSFLLVGWEQAWIYITVILPNVNRALAQNSPGNNAIAVVIRNATGQPILAEFASLALRAAVLGLLALAAWRAPRAPAAAFALGVTTLMLLPPVIWDHYFVLAYLPWLDALARSRRRHLPALLIAFFLISGVALVYHMPDGWLFLAQLLPISGAFLLLGVQLHDRLAQGPDMLDAVHPIADASGGR